MALNLEDIMLGSHADVDFADPGGNYFQLATPWDPAST